MHSKHETPAVYYSVSNGYSALTAQLWMRIVNKVSMLLDEVTTAHVCADALQACCRYSATLNEKIQACCWPRLPLTSAVTNLSRSTTASTVLLLVATSPTNLSLTLEWGFPLLVKWSM
jgi:hypothetical protein